ncbi:SDR family NAD(P)-dependent oxidoreductase [Mesorhizobium sp. RIZ17]|uniref:SDR family NAD(P)-dependent oxidoreductase n=1 Tax=Mesorhizobium sp. RIZ17 TaxID=3132743 RepID=UPI003DA9E553
MTLTEHHQPSTLITGVGGSIGTAIIASLQTAGRSVITLSQIGMSKGDLEADFQDDGSLVDAVNRITLPLNGVVLAHGMLQPGPLNRVSPSEWRSHLNVNLNSIYAILHTVVPKLKAEASIVVISSTAGLDHSPVGGPHYTVSKWALNGLVRHLASELGPLSIRINSVCPGWIDNPMGRAFLADADIQAGISEIPLRRPGSADEVASVVKFLLGSESSYMTGALVPVSGGYRY